MAGRAPSISDAGSWDLHGLNEGSWVIIEFEWLVAGLFLEASGITAVTWQAGEANLLAHLFFGLVSATAMVDWLHGETDAVGELLDERLLVKLWK